MKWNKRSFLFFLTRKGLFSLPHDFGAFLPHQLLAAPPSASPWSLSGCSLFSLYLVLLAASAKASLSVVIQIETFPFLCFYPSVCVVSGAFVAEMLLSSWYQQYFRTWSHLSCTQWSPMHIMDPSEIDQCTHPSWISFGLYSMITYEQICLRLLVLDQCIHHG